MCSIDTGADVKLFGRKNIHELDKANISYKTSEASTSLSLKGCIGAETTQVTHTVRLKTLRLPTSEGPVEFNNFDLFIIEKDHEMILGLPFSKSIGFDIIKYLVNNYEALKGTDMNKQDGPNEA